MRLTTSKANGDKATRLQNIKQLKAKLILRTVPPTNLFLDLLSITKPFFFFIWQSNMILETFILLIHFLNLHFHIDTRSIDENAKL